MITDSFDNKTEEILKPWKKEDAKKVDACILTLRTEQNRYTALLIKIKNLPYTCLLSVLRAA